ncbi:hypothetical protein BUALT_Bualt17G0105400 [Buddleja alternifolia]|uniref:Uncharacterized protein n=1 Tax=Buddleja alternifolia TaxID=168488 RepID=A0AAV6WE75_9LAMI|nr:hypothetical protein BUALT_Bualt17G0105400 [Buddleja alternifolia]
MNKHVENIQSDNAVALYAMNAGEGTHSYVQNSTYQRGVLDVAKPIIEEEIATKLDIKTPNGYYGIADFGCSTGHNSFPAMQTIIQALNKKHKHHQTSLPKTPEFYVFFNDVVSNDFNTLFSSLPPNDHDYHAIAVPGDFHGRLLPEYSLHFAYSSWSLHWLTEVPKAVADRDSPAWNKGQILYTQDEKEIYAAYLSQYGKDIESFMEARAVEMVDGGLMALLVPAVPAVWNPKTEYTILCDVNLNLGSCLMDMAKEGKISETKIDTFNIPHYFTTPQQLREILERSNDSFTIERMETLNNAAGKNTDGTIKARAASKRAVHERLLADHFGIEIIDELFDRYMKKLADSPVFLNPDNDKTIVILAVLKRNARRH